MPILLVIQYNKDLCRIKLCGLQDLRPAVGERLLRLVFTSDGVGVGVVIRRIERYDLMKIKLSESEAEH